MWFFLDWEVCVCQLCCDRFEWLPFPHPTLALLGKQSFGWRPQSEKPITDLYDEAETVLPLFKRCVQEWARKAELATSPLGEETLEVPSVKEARARHREGV